MNRSGFDAGLVAMHQGGDEKQGRKLRVWAVEPYFGGSHKAHLEGLARCSRHDFTLFTLPGRFWKWRMHGGALSLGERVRRSAAGSSAEAGPQLFLVSDMLDLPVFSASIAPDLDRIPTILYFHENQLTYPLPQGVERDLDYGFKNLTGIVAAQRVFFNSGYHKREFASAAADLLRAMPDEIPSWILDDLEAKAGVLPVGCDLRRLDRYRLRGLSDAAAGRWGDPARGPLLLWNARWEYDKAPGELFEALYALKGSGVRFRLAMAGPNQGTPTADFLRAKTELDDCIVQWGKVAKYPDYASLLWAADVVVSTAIHEFFGIAIVEAIHCGCRPVLPGRLSYPEIVPVEAHGDVLYGEGELVSALTRALAEPRAWSQEWQRAWVAGLDWVNLKDRYDEEIEGCWEDAERARSPRGLAW